MGQFTQNRENLATRVLKICGAIGKGQNPMMEDMQDASDSINLAISDLENEGFDLFQVEKQGITLTASDTVVGYRCIRSHTSDATNEPGVGTAYLMYWVADTSAVSGTWASGTAYHSIGDLTLDADTLDMLWLNVKIGGNDMMLEILDYMKYEDIPVKSQTGQPIQAYIDYQNTPVMYLYYQPDKPYFLTYMRVKKVTSLDSASSAPQYAENWYNALIYKSAVYMADILKLPLNERSLIDKRAEKLIGLAKSASFRGTTDMVSQGCYR